MQMVILFYHQLRISHNHAGRRWGGRPSPASMVCHTNFRSRPVIVNNTIKATVDDVTELPLFEEDGRTRHLGTNDTAGLLLYVTYSVTDITLHVFHGIADLRGTYSFLHTLLKSYFAELGLAEAVLPEPDSVDTMPFYEHVMSVGSPAAPKGLYNPDEHEIFALPVERFGKDTTRQRLFEIDIPLEPLLALARKSKSSVVPTMQAAIGHAIHETFEVGDKDVVGYTPIDLRKHYHVETGGNGSSIFSIPYAAELDECDLGERARRLRSEMDAQITPENIYAIVAFNCKRMVERVLKAPYPIVVVAKTVTDRGRQIDAGHYTYGVPCSKRHNAPWTCIMYS